MALCRPDTSRAAALVQPALCGDSCGEERENPQADRAGPCTLCRLRFQAAALTLVPRTGGVPQHGPLHRVWHRLPRPGAALAYQRRGQHCLLWVRCAIRAARSLWPHALRDRGGPEEIEGWQSAARALISAQLFIFWMLPIYLASLVFNVVWCQDIADEGGPLRSRLTPTPWLATPTL